MGYYKGDHYRAGLTRYRGDYYRGDPGFLSGLGRALKVVAGAGIGYLTGGPKGAITGAATAAAGAVKTGIQQETLAAGDMAAMDAARVAAINATHATLLQQPLVNIAAPPPPMLGPGTAMVLAGMPGMPSMSGYRWNKSTYATRGGGTSKWMPGLQLHARGTVQVKSRRMNVGNARALRRAIRRARGFAKLAGRVLVATKRFKATKKRK
jgi:hypothetical protein